MTLELKWHPTEVPGLTMESLAVLLQLWVVLLAPDLVELVLVSLETTFGFPKRKEWENRPL